MKSYALVNSNELPSIKPDAPYLILMDGTIILQGFGVIAKFSTVMEAEDFCNNSKSLEGWGSKLAEKRIEDNFQRFMESCKSKKL